MTFYKAFVRNKNASVWLTTTYCVYECNSLFALEVIQKASGSWSISILGLELKTGKQRPTEKKDYTKAPKHMLIYILKKEMGRSKSVVFVIQAKIKELHWRLSMRQCPSTPVSVFLIGTQTKGRYGGPSESPFHGPARLVQGRTGGLSATLAGPGSPGSPSRTGGGAVFPNWISSEPVPTVQFGSHLVPGNSPEKIRCQCIRKKGTEKQMGGGESLFTIFLVLFNGGWLAMVDFSFHWTLSCVGKDAVLQTF